MGDFFKNLVYSKEDIITFPNGIPGFEKYKEFVIVSIPEYVPFEPSPRPTRREALRAPFGAEIVWSVNAAIVLKVRWLNAASSPL